MKKNLSLITILMFFVLLFSCLPAYATRIDNPNLSADCNGFVLTGTYYCWADRNIIGFCINYEVTLQNAEESTTITGTAKIAIPEGTADGAPIDFSIPISWSKEFCGVDFTATAHLDLYRQDLWSAPNCQDYKEYLSYDLSYGPFGCSCDDGCTLTFGYWKTHSSYGPAPYDATWALILPFGAGSPFFLSGKSYYDVLWTPPKGGSPYYILAHQYIAALLNQMNGAASTKDVTKALVEAGVFFGTHTPTSIVLPSVKKIVLEAANILVNYNEGNRGPGHCN